MSKVKDRTPGKIVGHQDRQLFSGASTTLRQLTDVEAPSPADKQFLEYDLTAQKWKPTTVGGSPIVFMGNGAWDKTAKLDGSDPMYGMPVGTTPDVNVWPPIPGDSYIDLNTGVVISFTGPEGIIKLGTGPTSGTVTQLKDGQSVLEVLNDPTNRLTDNFNTHFIVGNDPIGAFVSHEGHLAHAGLQKWIFELPATGLALKAQYPGNTWTFDGSRWTTGLLY